PIDQAWPLLTDIERIAPCVPGFQLTSAEDGEYRGTMKVKVGAVQTSYDCVVRFVERDDEAHRAVIAAQGSETKGQGGVTAKIVSTLRAEGDGRTHASVVTTLNVTGRVAQFGRGILADVSDRLVKRFVNRLEAKVIAGEDESAASDEPPSPQAAPTSGPNSPGAGPAMQGPQPAAESEPLDLLSVAGAAMAKRLGIAAAVLLGLLLMLRLRSAR
ncbi:MAG: SRPBCC domain-containing protein, partial [Solirubrobacteraceae bacterium]